MNNTESKPCENSQSGEYSCGELFNCCDCGDTESSTQCCRYCWSCNACENCLEDASD